MLSKGNEAIRESFQLLSGQEIKPTCSGKLLSSTYSLGVGMNHDINCACCSDRIGGSIPIVIQLFTLDYFPVHQPVSSSTGFQCKLDSSGHACDQFRVTEQFQQFQPWKYGRRSAIPTDATANDAATHATAAIQQFKHGNEPRYESKSLWSRILILFVLSFSLFHQFIQ